MDDTWDLAIVGGGAAGLAAAIFAGQTRPGLRIAVLDGARSLGAKILVSGGGRCNVTHDRVTPADFNGSKNVVRNILAAFDERAAVAWFESLGVLLKREETGKLFPTTDSAKTVLAALLDRCNQLGVMLLTNHRVSDVGRAEPEGPLVVTHAHGRLRAGRVILATGGQSLPKTGSDGVGWSIARRLGHSVTDTCAALVPLMLEDSFFHAELSGLSHEAELSTFVENKLADRRTGSLLWTHFGVSGPAAMDASRHWTLPRSRNLPVRMTCNLLPGRSYESVEKLLLEFASTRPRQALLSAIRTLVPERLAAALLGFVTLDPQLPLAHLSRDARRSLASALTALPLPIVRDRGWNYAEVTAGGVPLSEIDFRTMASRKVPGLYLVGEILDCDGRIGGFNFQWAWATGYLAGRAAASAGA